MLQVTSFKFQERGFTMVELLVALTFFAIVVSVSTGVFVNSLRTQRAVTALMAANNNASLALERMTREIRTGARFSVTSGGSGLRFTDQNGQLVNYGWNETDGFLTRNGISLTGDNVKVDYLIFNLMGEGIGDGQSTRVNIRLGISADDARVGDVVTSLQTSVSSRQLDI